MTLDDLKQGDAVQVNARVVRVRGEKDGDPAYWSVDLQLSDGQFLQTNVKNLAEKPKTKPEAKAVDGPPETKAVTSAPKTKALTSAPKTKGSNQRTTQRSGARPSNPRRAVPEDEHPEPGREAEDETGGEDRPGGSEDEGQ